MTTDNCIIKTAPAQFSKPATAEGETVEAIKARQRQRCATSQELIEAHRKSLTAEGEGESSGKPCGHCGSPRHETIDCGGKRAQPATPHTATGEQWQQHPFDTRAVVTNYVEGEGEAFYNIVADANNEERAKQIVTEHNAHAALEAAARCALADLEGIMPEFEPSGDREHPAWTTIEELRAALALAGK